MKNKSQRKTPLVFFASHDVILPQSAQHDNKPKQAVLVTMC